MIWFVTLVGAIGFSALKLRRQTSSVLSHDDTTVVNGVFVLLIFLSHSTQYFTLSSVSDILYQHFQSFHNQWVVTTFLAFSGYGCMRQIMKGGVDYVRAFPRRRLLKTLINFDCAVLLFLLLDWLVGDWYDVVTVIGSFVGLTSVGNSNWYIFTILALYLFTYVAGRFFWDDERRIAFCVLMLTVIYITMLSLLGFPSRFVNTALCYPLGVYLALYRDRFLKLFRIYGWQSAIPISVALVATYRMRTNVWGMNIASCFFVGGLIWLLCRFEIRSRFFLFVGRHSFSIFILQRIPLRIIFGANPSMHSGLSAYNLVMICLFLTIAAAVLFDLLLGKLDYYVIRDATAKA